MSLSVPIAFVVFNRPDHTAQSFARIRRARPDRLFVIADGPRPARPEEAAQCALVRDLVSRVDWPCIVDRVYSETNLGCRERVRSGLDYVFRHVDSAIVIEDDCVPTDDFFRLCTAMLAKYADDPRVVAITGDNFARPTGCSELGPSYYFSKYLHVWGWASWSRAWALYDDSMEFWPEYRESERFKQTHPDSVERRYWRKQIDRVYRKDLDTWDYVFLAAIWNHGGLTLTPSVNLVENIGFGPDATHTWAPIDMPGTGVASLGRLVDDIEVAQDPVVDRRVFDDHFGGRSLRSRRQPWGFIRFAISSAAKQARRRLRPATSRT